MSAKVMDMIMNRYPAEHGEYKLALALGNFASEDGRNIYPSVETMALKSRQDVRSVQRHLKRMLETGWLLLVRAGGGRGRPAVYRINPRWIAGEDLPLGQANKGDTKPASKQDETVTPVTQKGDTGVVSYKNLKEPNTPLPPTGGDAGFEALLAAYPKHRRNLRAAKRVWAKLSPDENLQFRILAAATQQAKRAEWQAEEGRRVPNLSKWLADQCWRATHEERAPAAQTAVSSHQGAPASRLTQEQLQENARKAREHVAKAKAIMQGKVSEAMQ